MRVSPWVRFRHVGKHRADRNPIDGCAWCDSVTVMAPCTCRVRCTSGSCMAPQPRLGTVMRWMAKIVLATVILVLMFDTREPRRVG